MTGRRGPTDGRMPLLPASTVQVMESSGSAASPDADATSLRGPRLELDELLTQLVDRAQDVLAAQRRLRGLLRANRLIVGDHELPVVLHRVVEAGCELVRAPLGALSIVSPGGGMEHYLHVDGDDETAPAVEHLPAFDGLVTALIRDRNPIRVRDMAEDPRSTGAGPGLSTGHSFLGVPVRVRDEVYGGLYLSGHDDGEVSVEDEELLFALAATAGVAIANARLFDEARRRQEWLQASTEITRQLLANEGEEPLQVIARRLQEIADADAVNVVLPTAAGRRLMVEVATGAGVAQLTALSYPADGTVSGVVIETGHPVLIANMVDEHDHTVHLSEVVPVGPLMVLPLVGAYRVRGALVVGRLQGRPQFTPADVDMATTFANHAAVALELDDARTAQEQVALLEDRDRIARDLHDHVMQRLFGAGMTVESIAAGLGPDPRADRLARVVRDIDDTIRQIRTSIFQLRGPFGPQTGAVRSQLLGVCAEAASSLGFDPAVTFSGPVDAVVSHAVLDDLVAVVREALSNVARHARAGRVRVDVAVAGRNLVLEVDDDGAGIGPTARRSGLANLRERAERRGGNLETTSPRTAVAGSGTEGGTRLRWTIPLT